MKKSAVSVFVIAGLLSVLLPGCQMGGGTDKGTQESATEPVIRTEESPLPYQFVRKYGIIKSEYPVYELDTVIETKLPQQEKTVSLTFASCHKQELIVSMVLDDYSEVEKIEAGGELPADGTYHTLSDGTMFDAERYQNEIWKSGEGLFLTGPGIPEAGIKPLESLYASYSDYFEAYGHRRYIIEAKFEIPSIPDHENNLSGYALRLLDLEKLPEFALKRAPEYGTLEELAAEEHGSIDTHDGISIISMGEKVDEGILINWYVYREAGEGAIGIAYQTPLQELEWPTISSEEKQYPIKQLSVNPYGDNVRKYGLSDVKRFGRWYRFLFDVPREEQDATFKVNIPGISFLNSEESPRITLSIPEDYEELNKDISWKDGSVRILGITRMKEPQTAGIQAGQEERRAVERPAVYIDVMAVHEDKDLTLTGLLCQRKLRWNGWERERYDYDEKGSLSGFCILYDEGDTEVTLKFNRAVFYWNQSYVMELPLPPS